MPNSTPQPQIAFRNGTFLPSLRQNTRIRADGRKMDPRHMDRAEQTCSMTGVVYALPLGALFASLFRYPSPIGRPSDIPRWPSIFSLISCDYVPRRAIAQIRLARDFALETTLARPIYWPTPLGTSNRGETTCKRHSKPWWFSLGWAGLLPVATDLWSKHCSGPVPGQVRRPFWTATSSPGRLLGPLATSFTARRASANAAEARQKRGENLANPSQWGKPCSDSHWQGSHLGVSQPQWGASNQRGVYYEQSTDSYGPVGRIGGVCRARGVEPYGLRPVYDGSDQQLTGLGGAHRAVLTKPEILTKRMTRDSGPCALSCSERT